MKTRRALAATASALILAASAFPQTRTVAITVDDLPFVNADPTHPSRAAVSQSAAKANRRMLTVFRRRHIPVTGFVNQQGVDELASGPAILRAWINAGLDLGNHTYSHRDFDDLTIEQFEQEILRDESEFLPLMQAAGRTSKFFRFPFNHTGDTQEKHDAVATFLSARGYAQAPCTIETSDYIWNTAYVKMLAQHDRASAARLRSEYVAFTAAQVEYFEKLNHQVWGYDPPQIMLLHDNHLNADMIDELISVFAGRQYSFVTLAQAEADAAYRLPDSLVTKYGPIWGYRWARERGVKVDGRLEPEPPKWISEYGEKPPPSRRPRSAF